MIKKQETQDFARREPPNQERLPMSKLNILLQRKMRSHDPARYPHTYTTCEFHTT